MPTRLLQKFCASGAAISIGLVLFGRALVPAERIEGVVASTAVLIAYGLIIWLTLPLIDKRHPELLPLAALVGLIAGLVFVSEIILEYVLLPKDNTAFGLVEFGIVFMLYLGSSAINTFRTLSVRTGVLSAVCTSMLASLIWVLAFLGVFYLFYGTPQQMQVQLAEGDFADFAQSGLKDFKVFVMEDYMGAVAYHLLFGPLFAAVVGVLGALVGKGIRKGRLANSGRN